MNNFKTGIKPLFISIILAVCFLIFLPSTSLANNDTITVSLSNPTTPGSLEEFLGGVIIYLRNIVGVLAVLFIVLGGVLHIIAGNTGNPQMATTAKQCLGGALIGVALVFAAPAFLGQILIITGDPADSTRSLNDIILAAISFLTSIVGVLAVIALVISSIMYLTAAGNPTQATKATQGITYAILGVVIASSALILIGQIKTLVVG